MQRVYKITNKLNNKCYIGITNKPVNERFREHILEAYRGSNRPICISIKKHGQENFYVECLAETETREEVFSLEKYYIEKFNSFYKGYNATFGGDGCEGESNPKAKRMNVYDCEGKLLYENISSQRMEQIYQIEARTISRWSLGRKMRNGKKLFFVNKLNVFIVDIDKIKECDLTFKGLKSHNSNDYLVFHHDTNTFETIERAKTVSEKFNIPLTTVHRRGRGQQKTHYFPKHNISIITENLYNNFSSSEKEKFKNMNLEEYNKIVNNTKKAS